MHRFLLLLIALGTLCVATPSASAIEVKITAQALERTLKTQLFNGPEGRYYIRGDAKSSCFIENISESRELNFFLVPFLSRKLPQQMKVNAADLMRQVLSRSAETTGYAFSLTSLKIHSMLVQAEHLVLDVDAGMNVD